MPDPHRPGRSARPRFARVRNILLLALLACTAGALALRAATPPAADATTAPAGKRFGVNVSGGEFGESSLPGRINGDYIYPADSTSNRYFSGKGLTLVRLPVRWERVQPQAFAPLSSVDVAGVRASLDAAHSAGQSVLLDLHNYGRYYGAPLTRADAPRLADLWARLAREFRGHPALYGYELMNEPHDLPEGPAAWADLAQAAADAVRREDTSAWLLVPGYGWQTARFWPENNAALDVRDPAGRLLYAAHQYFDADFSGTYGKSYDADGASESVGVERLQPFLDWLTARGAYGILTEYGVPDSDPRWLTVLDRFLTALDAHPRIAGGTYWSSGPWWGAYPLSVEPRDGQDRPQMAVLERYRSRGSDLLPSPSPAPTPTPAPSPSPAPTPTPSAAPVATPTPSPAPSATASPTPSTKPGATPAPERTPRPTQKPKPR